MRIAHCTVALAALLFPAAAGFGQTPSAKPTDFTVFFQGVAIGAEQVTVTRTPQGISIEGNERIGPPLNIIARRAEFRYTTDWRPLECIVEGSLGDLQVFVHTTVSGTSATTALTQGRNSGQKTDEIAPDALLLPNIFFGAYEAVAARLLNAKAGDELPGYIPPQSSLKISVTSVADDRVRTQNGLLLVRRYTL